MSKVHASRTTDRGKLPLCGGIGPMTKPNETVNCPDCRTIMNHIHQNYPLRFGGYWDIRPTRAESHAAAERLMADAYGGADD